MTNEPEFDTMNYMQTSLKRVRNYLKEGVIAVKKNQRYAAVVGIFAVVLYYHFAIVPHPESTDKNKNDTTATAVMRQVADLDRNHPLKQYKQQLLSQKGDWYRVSVVAESLDEDESLRIALTSSVGKTQEVGHMTVSKGDGAKYAEFVIMTDGSYENVTVEKEGAVFDASVWQNGRIRLARVFVSRLDVSSARDARMLTPTMFGKRDVRILTTTATDAMSGIQLPVDTHFVRGQTFDVSEESYLLSVNMRINQNGATGTGKYRLELRAYDSEHKRVGDKVFQRDAFSVKDLKTMADTDGSYRFILPYRLESGKSYFLGVSDDYVQSAKKIQVEIFQDNAKDGSIKMPYFVLFGVKKDTTLSGALLTHAVIEDTGSRFQYRYQSNHEATDMMDVFASSDDVSFDSGRDAVIGKEKEGSFFVYKIDTMHPFEDFRMEAVSLSNDTDKKIRVEYSFDNAFWKEVSVMQQDAMTNMFDAVVHNVDAMTKTIYVRVSYSGSKEGNGVFGLKDFRVTATLPK
jgi:hypothetical protein